MTTANCGKIVSTPAKAMTQIPNGGTGGDGKIICVERADSNTTYVKLAKNLKVDGTCETGKILK